MNDCTLASNTTSYGGGAYGSTLNRCLIQDNVGGDEGGGTYGGTLNHCIVSGNRSSQGGGAARDAVLNDCLLVSNTETAIDVDRRGGGGAHQCSLNNCTVAGNSSFRGAGGIYLCAATNCIVFGNSGPMGANYLDSTFGYSCTTPDPGGTGNVTNAPQFVNAAAGNYRLLANSPCINAGNNAYVQGTTDLDGNLRIVRGTVDMGAYEIQVFTNYVDWAAGITNGLTNATDCAAGDGVPNLLRYAAGCSYPMEADDLARLGRMGGGAPALTFNRNLNAIDLMLVIQGADSISNGAAWRGVATNVGGSWLGATNVEESGTGNSVVCTVTDPAALQSNRFLRLKVSRP